MRPFLRVLVMIALTHVRKTNGFPDSSKTAVFILRGIHGFPF